MLFAFRKETHKTGEAFIIVLFFNEQIHFMNFLPDISFLWLNAIGAIGVVALGLAIQSFMPSNKVINA